jgi:1-acyl-sn-glycerol-3-phosphate acyltransferase
MKSFLQYLFYEFLHLWFGFGLRLFFRNVYTFNSKNLKQFTPTIYIGNHENALMDAILIITGSHRQPYSMTRSDVFKKPLVRAFLYSIRMLPVYRQRDGIENMRKNGVIFDSVTDRLTQKRAVLIFPEGDQAMVHRLRNLKKGVFRFSFPAEEKTQWETGVHLLPCGLTYEKHYDAHRDFIMHVGEPIYLRDYKDLYELEPEKAIEQVKQDLASGMRKVMIDIHTKEYYDEQILLRKIFIPIELHKEGKPAHFGNFYLKGQEFNKRLNELLDNDDKTTTGLMEQVRVYRSELETQEIREETVRKSPGRLDVLLIRLTLLLSAPFYGMAWLLNGIPLTIAERYSDKLIKDAKFILTLRFGIGHMTYTFYCLLLYLVVIIFGGGWIMGLSLVLLVFTSMAVVFEWRRLRKRLGGYVRWSKLNSTKKEDISSSRVEILQRTAALFES